MGSSGSGRFGDYHVNSTMRTGSSGTQGGSESAEEISCPEEIDAIKLEDVATSEYYKAHRGIPLVGDAVHLRQKLYNGRLVVELFATGEIIGNLPTRYNFIRRCFESGLDYEGDILSSGLSPIPFIVVNLHD